jgi:hypothetical protein
MNAIVPIPPEASLFAAFSDFSHAPSRKNLSKSGFCRRKGLAFCESRFAKKFSGAGEHFWWRLRPLLSRA